MLPFVENPCALTEPRHAVVTEGAVCPRPWADACGFKSPEHAAFCSVLLKPSCVDFRGGRGYREARAGVPVVSLRALAHDEKVEPDQRGHAHVHEPGAKSAAG